MDGPMKQLNTIESQVDLNGDGEFHVYPETNFPGKPHQDTKRCWCEPKQFCNNTEAEYAIYVHNDIH